MRERNALLLAGGYAPAYPENELSPPPLAVVNEAINAVLEGHLPSPAIVVDRHWELVAGNAAIGLLTAGAAALRYRTAQGELAFFSTTTVFGTPLDVTVAELAIEAFYPADAATADALKRSAT